MGKESFYYVRVDEYNKWTPTMYRKVTQEELDRLIVLFGERVMNLCSRGQKSAMSMWAYFKNSVSCGSYDDAIHAYDILAGDKQSLEEREHELRKAWDEYQELRHIRSAGSLENYYLKKAEQERFRFEKYADAEKEEK